MPVTSRQITTALLVLALSAPEIDAQINPGFEAERPAVDASGAVPGWEARRASAVLALDASVRHSGDSSLRVESRDTRGRGRFFQALDAHAIGADRVRVSAFIKMSAETSGVAALRVLVRDSSGIIYVDRTDASSATGASGWAQVVIDVPLAPTAVELSVGGDLTGRGTVWFDDFAIEPVDTARLPAASAAALRYVEAALAIIEAHALVRTRLDWTAFRDAVQQQARGARSVADSYLAIRYALGALGDGHSHFRTAAQTAALARRPVENARTRRPFVAPQADLIGDTIAYLDLPGFAGGSHIDRVEFAEALQRRIAELDAAAACGWIIDLRGNSGGNLWPMLAGLGPLLGDGDAGASVWPDGARRRFWYEDGKAGLDDYVQLRVRGEAYRLLRADDPVAVVVDEGSASAAEILTIAFAARPGTRTFGAPTAGATTATRTFRLSDGAELILAVARTSDRNGHVYAGPIEPDELVPTGDRGAPLATQPVIAAARRWLEAEADRARPAGCAQPR